jgi:hypothetical protein
MFTASALEFRITSPDKGEVWPKSSMTNRVLRWKEKARMLVAEVTFSTANYSGMGERAETETFEFTLPGTSFDPAQQVFYATAPTGEKVAIAQRTKQILGNRIDLYKTAIIRVARFRTELTLTLDVNTVLPVETPESINEDGTVSVPINSLLKR